MASRCFTGPFGTAASWQEGVVPLRDSQKPLLYSVPDLWEFSLIHHTLQFKGDHEM